MSGGHVNFGCRLARIGGDELGPWPVRRHTASCLACQASAARDRRIGRELSALRRVVEIAPVSLVAAVELRLDDDNVFAAGENRGRVASAMATSAAVTATAVGAVAAVMVWRKSHSTA